MHNKNSGFTLLELLIVLAVIAIAAAYGIPKLNHMLHKDRIISELNTLSAHIAYARSEAVRRGVSVSVQSEAEQSEENNGEVVFTKTSNWSNGYRVYIDNDGDGEPNDEADQALRVISGLNLNNVTLNSPNTKDIVFNSDGTLADGSGEPLTLVDGEHIYTLDIDPIGHVRINHTLSAE